MLFQSIRLELCNRYVGKSLGHVEYDTNSVSVDSAGVVEFLETDRCPQAFHAGASPQRFSKNLNDEAVDDSVIDLHG